MKQKIVIILSFIFISFNYSIAQEHKQTRSRYQNSTSKTIARAFSSASTSGNLIVVHVSWDNPNGCGGDEKIKVSKVHDNKGNSYHKIGNTTFWNGDNYGSELWYAYDIIGGGGAITITATFTDAPDSFSQLYMSEYSGISKANPLDQFSVAKGSSSSVSSGAKDIQFSNQLVYGISIGCGTMSKGSGFTLRSSDNGNVVQDKTAATAGSSQSALFSSSGGNWVALMATFKSMSSSPLPIELTSFDVYEGLDKTVLLSWQTASETNNSEFEMYRSRNGYEWELIGSQKGAGNSTRTINYTASDLSPLTGINYYRLKQIDFDGTSTYSEIKYISIDPKKAGVKVYPNPTNGDIFVESGDANATDILITNSLGEVLPIVKEKTNDTTYKLDLSNLPKGIYFISSPFSTEKIIRN